MNGLWGGLSQTHFNHHSVDNLMLTCTMDSEPQVNLEQKNLTVAKEKTSKNYTSMSYKDLL